jgi:2-methylcitrate dehydratase PrpD
MDYTLKLADFCASVSYENLPGKIVTKAKQCLLDYVANVYGSLELDAVNRSVSHIRSIAGSGPASVFGCGFKSDLHHAAFVNGITAEAIEAQDGVRFGGNHPGVAVIPAALAVGELDKLGGKRIIEALVVGYEAANRPASAMHPWHTLSGFLPTGTCGAFGAAAAYGRLKNFDTPRMASALGNAGYLLPISMAEQLMGGYTIKITQGGQAAMAGLMAAGLAGSDVDGAPYTLEGSDLNGGFTKITTAAEPKLERISDQLGEVFSLSDVYFKPFTACRHTHGAAQAVLELQKEQKLEIDLIQAIDVYTYGIAQLAVGKEVNEESSFVSAQFSIPYVVAVCLMDGELGPRQLTEQRLADRNLIELSKKVTIQTDEALEAVYPDKTSSRVCLKLKNGSSLEKQVDVPKGDPRDPMTTADIMAKVKRFSGERNQDKIQKICDMIMDLENLDDITGLVELI